VDRQARKQLGDWLAAVADGDRAAFDPLFDALAPVVSAYCARVLGDRALADDTAQDVLVRVLTRAGEFDRERDALAWVLGIATWQCRTARRTVQRRGEVDLAAAPEPRATADDAVDRDLVRAAVAAIGDLSPTDAATIAAAIFDDDSLRAGVAPATFRKRLERALGRLRTAWRSRHGAL
jgi:RNA polymerase sigma-70 factor (ECF subfamily)